MAAGDGTLLGGGQQGVNTVADALNEAANASSPADTARWLYAAVRLQQQQIEQLELAVGAQEQEATDGIRARARRLIAAKGRL
jgi:hypothetical protein